MWWAHMKCLVNYFLHLCGNPINDFKGQCKQFLVKAARPRPQVWTIKGGAGGTALLVTGEIYRIRYIHTFCLGPTVRNHILFILSDFIFKTPPNFSNPLKWFQDPLTGHNLKSENRTGAALQRGSGESERYSVSIFQNIFSPRRHHSGVILTPHLGEQEGWYFNKKWFSTISLLGDKLKREKYARDYFHKGCFLRERAVRYVTRVLHMMWNTPMRVSFDSAIPLQRVTWTNVKKISTRIFIAAKR